MSGVLARGPNFVYGKEFVCAEYGQAVWERVLDRLDEATRAVWSGTLMVTAAYPFLAFKKMVAALSAEIGDLPDEQTTRMYEFIADRSLTTIHRIFFKLANPSFVIARYPMLWDRFFLAGQVEVSVAERRRAEIRFRVPEIFLDWLPPACYGFSKKAIEMAGGSNLKQEEAEHRALDGDDWRIVYRLSWDE